MAEIILMPHRSPLESALAKLGAAIAERAAGHNTNRSPKVVQLRRFEVPRSLPRIEQASARPDARWYDKLNTPPESRRVAKEPPYPEP
jgi:hypothetical protein